MKNVLATFAIAALSTAAVRADIYTQDFSTLGSGLPAGWSVEKDASATSVGTPGAAFTSTATSWSDPSGAFKNVASSAAGSAASTATQAAAADRALGVRPIATFGDPGTAFTFNFSTSGVTVSSLSFDLQMLSVQGRSQTYTIQYGVGPNPTSFTDLGTYADPGVFGSTTKSFTTADFSTNLDNQSNLFFRVVALSVSSGAGSRDTIAIDNFSLTSSGPISPIAVAVPEPATWMLMGVGLLVGAQRFRRKS